MLVLPHDSDWSLYVRACQVLALNLTDLSFTSAFIQHCSASIDVLKQLAKESGAGERLDATAALCHRMRMLYRDCAKPPPPPTRLPSRTVSTHTPALTSVQVAGVTIT